MAAANGAKEAGINSDPDLLIVDGKTNKDTAWYYPETKDTAKHVKSYMAFWKGVNID